MVIYPDFVCLRKTSMSDSVLIDGLTVTSWACTTLLYLKTSLHIIKLVFHQVDLSNLSSFLFLRFFPHMFPSTGSNALSNRS